MKLSRKAVQSFKKIYNNWTADKALTLSAALSYYTVFSIAPLLLITLAICAIFFGEEASRGQIISSLSGLLGQEGARSVEEMIKASSVKKANILATIVGVVVLFLGATTVFSQLQDALNQIWKVRSKPGKGIWIAIRQRLLSFSLILVMAFLLLVSLLVSAGLSAFTNYTKETFLGSKWIWRGVDILLSLGVTTVLFAAIYKVLPDVKLKWKHVWSGGFMTAVLFTVGKHLIGLYIGNSSFSSTYGAAASAIIIIVWTYYASAILLFGAEYTKIQVMKNSQQIELKSNAEWVPQY